MDPLDLILDAPDAAAVLGRHLAVRLLDVSRSGCLLLADRRIEEGAAGMLRVAFENAVYVEAIQIVRCHPCVSGTSGYRLGGQFLWLEPPADRSLRRLIATLEPRTASALRYEIELPS